MFCCFYIYLPKTNAGCPFFFFLVLLFVFWDSVVSAFSSSISLVLFFFCRFNVYYYKCSNCKCEIKTEGLLLCVTNLLWSCNVVLKDPVLGLIIVMNFNSPPLWFAGLLYFFIFFHTWFMFCTFCPTCALRITLAVKTNKREYQILIEINCQGVS